MDEAKLQEFMGRLVGDMGGAAIMANVILGEELGLYRAMADGQPVTPDELAARTTKAIRYPAFVAVVIFAVVFIPRGDETILKGEGARLALFRMTAQGPQPLREVLLAVNLRTASHLGLRFSIRQQQEFNLTFPEP